MNLLDLFSGIGGFHEGLREAGFKFDNCFHAEVDKYACQVYHKHFPESKCLGSVTDIQVSTERGEEDANWITTIKSANGTFQFEGKISLVCFGFPCQDLSLAGHRKGFSGTRSSLFFEAMRIIRDSRPEDFIFENVKGLFSSSEGRDFELVLREIADSGYDGQWQLLNTRWYLPQNRERIYFVGYPGGGSRSQIFPITEDDGLHQDSEVQAGSEHDTKPRGKLRDSERSEGRGSGFTCWDFRKRKRELAETKVAGCLAQRDYKGPYRDGAALIQVDTIGKDSEATRVYDPDGCAKTIKNGGGMGAKTGLYEVKAVKTPERPTVFGNGRRTKNDGEPMFTLTRQDFHGVEVGVDVSNTVNCDGYLERGSRGRDEDGKAYLTSQAERRIRRLTPTECERLQGFPDGWTKGLSDTQRYKCLGNAVSVPVVKAVGKRML